MFLINGRISWPLFLMLVYCTLVAICTDLAWRLFAGPAAMFAGGGLAALLLGCGAIVILSRRATPR
jgi:hypothetical protein